MISEFIFYIHILDEITLQLLDHKEILRAKEFWRFKYLYITIRGTDRYCMILIAFPWLVTSVIQLLYLQATRNASGLFEFHQRFLCLHLENYKRTLSATDMYSRTVSSVG